MCFVNRHNICYPLILKNNPKLVCDNVNIPVIASGGCGSIKDIVEVFEKTNCDAALIASLLHYGEVTINEIKDELYKNNINVRRTINN